MKEYLDLAISTTIMLFVSPILIGIALTGALVSGKPVIYGASSKPADEVYKVSTTTTHKLPVSRIHNHSL